MGLDNWLNGLDNIIESENHFWDMLMGSPVTNNFIVELLKASPPSSRKGQPQIPPYFCFTL